MFKQIPNALTLLNLSCGVLAIMTDHLMIGLGLIAASLFFDVFDGLAARALNATSPIGKDLDSLSDLVSFGVAPAILFSKVSSEPTNIVYAGICFYVLCGAIRLARFNNMESSADFIGLAIPGAASFLCGFILIFLESPYEMSPVHQFLVYVLGGGLMISPLRMFSLKALAYSDYRRWLLLILVLVILFSLLIKPYWAVSVGVAFYLLLSIVYHILSSNVKNRV